MAATTPTIVRIHDDGQFVENKKKLEDALTGPSRTHETKPLKGGRVEVDGLTPDEMDVLIYLRDIPASVEGK